jgi:hypothetical protein
MSEVTEAVAAAVARHNARPANQPAESATRWAVVIPLALAGVCAVMVATLAALGWLFA